MQAIELKDPVGFANEFLRLTLLQDAQSLTKRDLELLIFALPQRDGAFAHSVDGGLKELKIVFPFIPDQNPSAKRSALPRRQ